MEIIRHSKPWITDEDRAAVTAALESSHVGEVTLFAEFERMAAEYIGVKNGVSASTGTTALYYALKAVSAGPGSEVILPTFVCRAVLDAVIDSGATPVFADIGDDWCVNAETVSKKISDKTNSIILVHTYGISAGIDEISKLGFPVIEDFCPAFGGEIDGSKLGSLGVIGIASFYATKPLTTGEGGIALSNDESLIEAIRELKYGGATLEQGRKRFPLSDIQAALGISQLKRYNQFLERRKKIADYYFRELDNLPVSLPHHIRDRSIFFRFPIGVPGGYEKYPEKFAALGIDIARGGVDFPLHIRCGMPHGSLPASERLFVETLSIPIYPAMSDSEVERVAESCKRIFT